MCDSDIIKVREHEVEALRRIVNEKCPRCGYKRHKEKKRRVKIRAQKAG